MLERHPVEPLTSSTVSWQVAYGRALEMASFKGGFLMRTAHELRSPLNQIISLQQMILEGLCDDIEEEHQFVADAYAASLKMLEYLDLMIHVSKVEIGRLAPQLQPVSLATLFTQVQTLTAVQVADRNLRLTVELPEAAIQVQADPAWLCNLLVTLIEMAVAGGDRGTLHLGLTPASDAATAAICLTDDRPTTPWQESVELPPPAAFTLDDTLSDSLRMSLVQAMVVAMQGQVIVAPAADQSLTGWQITLPLAT